MKRNQIKKDYGIDNTKKFLRYKIQKNPIYYLYLYTYLLRMEEKFSTGKTLFHKVMFILYNKRKNRLGIKLGISIPRGVVGEGLVIHHFGSIAVNPNARIGKNCTIHGQNCIGEKSGFAPRIGDNCDIGYGAILIGNIEIGDNVTIGAGSVVTKSFKENGISICGVPAKKI